MILYDSNFKLIHLLILMKVILKFKLKFLKMQLKICQKLFKKNNLLVQVKLHNHLILMVIRL